MIHPVGINQFSFFFPHNHSIFSNRSKYKALITAGMKSMHKPHYMLFPLIKGDLNATTADC